MTGAIYNLQSARLVKEISPNTYSTASYALEAMRPYVVQFSENEFMNSLLVMSNTIYHPAVSSVRRYNHMTTSDDSSSSFKYMVQLVITLNAANNAVQYTKFSLSIDNAIEDVRLNETQSYRISLYLI